VVLHGNEEVAVEDVQLIGKTIGVKFNEDKSNMFNALFRSSSGKQVLVIAKGDGGGCIGSFVGEWE